MNEEKEKQDKKQKKQSAENTREVYTHLPGFTDQNLLSFLCSVITISK